MRTPETLTDELMNDSKRFTRVGIAVLVERKWHFIVSDHTNPLDQLRRLVIADVDTAACEKIDIQNQTNILPSTLRQGPFHSAHRLSRVL
jgi:hypothetical protein